MRNKILKVIIILLASLIAIFSFVFYYFLFESIFKDREESTLVSVEEILDESSIDTSEIIESEELVISDDSSEDVEEDNPSTKLEMRDVFSQFLLDYEPVSIDSIPEYFEEPYYTIDAIPHFSSLELSTDPWEYYSPLDDLGRCGVATAVLSKDTMPAEDRGSIGSIRPSGWHTIKYPDLIPDRYLYNRCHLIAYCLAGENANEKNLITGTRYMNVSGMLPFETMLSDYITFTGNHVLYRVTPIFVDDELVARGVQMEAYSVEDDGDEICFNVFVYNVQPGIEIDYSDGESRMKEK